jgi:hypothetical protein
MGGTLSSRARRRKQTKSISAPGGAASFTQQSLSESLLGSYVDGLDKEQIFLQFDGGTQLKRFWVCSSLIDKPLFVNMLSYCAAAELITCTEINKVWFDCADTAWLWDALDGIKGLGEISMGRYDYRCRHHRMRLTREEKRRHRARIAGMELDENREKRYRDQIGPKSDTVEKMKQTATKIVRRGSNKALSCVTAKRSTSGDGFIGMSDEDR